MAALANWSKYIGKYDLWTEKICKRWNLHWTYTDESLQSMQRFFSGEDLNYDTMLQNIRELIRTFPAEDTLNT